MFKNRFADLIVRGLKTQTIRPRRQRPLRVDQELSLRVWTGRPYMSKTRTLIKTRCSSVKRISIRAGGAILLDGKVLGPRKIKSLAVADGFSSTDEFLDFFDELHCLPFTGDLISWHNS